MVALHGLRVRGNASSTTAASRPALGRPAPSPPAIHGHRPAGRSPARTSTTSTATGRTPTAPRASTSTASGTGGIEQTFATKLNATYVVQFSLSGNPGTLEQHSNGVLQPVEQDPDRARHGRTDGAYSFDTAATATNTLRRHEVAGPGATPSRRRAPRPRCRSPARRAASFGPAIDNVIITETLATGANCKKGGWQTMVDSAGTRSGTRATASATTRPARRTSPTIDSGQQPAPRAATATPHGPAQLARTATDRGRAMLQRARAPSQVRSLPGAPPLPVARSACRERRPNVSPERDISPLVGGHREPQIRAVERTGSRSEAMPGTGGRERSTHGCAPSVAIAAPVRRARGSAATHPGRRGRMGRRFRSSLPRAGWYHRVDESTAWRSRPSLRHSRQQRAGPHRSALHGPPGSTHRRGKTPNGVHGDHRSRPDAHRE